MFLMSIISLGILAFLFYYFIKEHKEDKYAIVGLMLKLAAGISLGLIYKYHYRGGDTFQYFQESATLGKYFLLHPAQFYDIIFKTLELSELTNQLVFIDQPRALLFSKVVAVFYLLSGGNYWIISIFFSVINFLCIHMLVVELNKKYENITLATAISFYFLPTFVFWTSGLLKESLAIGSLAISIALAIRMMRMQRYAYFPYWIIFALAATMLWELKYFYAAIAIPILLSLLFNDYFIKRKKIHAGFLPIFFIIGILITSALHYNLDFSRVLNVVHENYLLGIKGAENSAIIYHNFDGSLHGFLSNLPLALFSGLFRPIVFEASNLMQFVVGIENVAGLLLLGIALWKLEYKKLKTEPMALAALIYIISLTIVLAFASPNFGTLSRYKVVYWPFFVLLVLIVFFRKGDKKKS